MILVASYCRVSTDSRDQANSFESQQRYFKEYIERQPEWELYRIYADEGITGTTTKKRAAFNRMIQDARLGKFRLILTKEVSRFSRNILDTIAYTRELRQLGVGVLFMTDGINTLDPDAELRLSIMGSIAQEESRKTSSRVKWGQTRQMEKGVVFGRSLLGYTVRGGRITVEPDEAEVVKLIFSKYGAEKKSTAAIARELQEAGYRTHAGSVKWSNSHIIKILRNEKYAGDLVQKKTFTPDYLTHTKKYNHGEEELIVLRDHHEPIVSRELWDAVQLELRRRDRRSALAEGHANRYLFSGKIRCGECGASFVSRKRRGPDGCVYRRWSCRTAAVEGSCRREVQGVGMGCDIGRTIRDELALDMLRQVFRSMEMDRDETAERIALLAAGAARSEGGEDIRSEIQRLTAQKAAVLDAFIAGRISEADMELLNRRCTQAIEEAQARLETVPPSGDAEELLGKMREYIRKIVYGEQISEALYKNILNRMVVYRNGRVDVYLNHLPQKWTFTIARTGASGSF